MTPLESYRFYLALKLHFTTEKFSVWGEKNWVRISEEKFLASPKVSKFKQFARVFPEERKLVQFYVANFAYGTSVFDLQPALESYTKWIKTKQALSHVVSENLETLSQEGPKCLEGDVPRAISLLNRETITIETLTILNRDLKFTSWSNWKNNFAFPTLWLRIEKLDKFVGIPNKQVQNTLNILFNHETV